MNGILNFIVSVATTPALLVGLIAMLGLILQKKSCHCSYPRLNQNICRIFSVDGWSRNFSYLAKSLCNDVSTCI